MIDVDLLSQNDIKANRGEKALLISFLHSSPDFRIPASLVKFASNLINVTDVEHMSDLIALLAHYGGQIYVIT
jgi:hypothetical protein